MNGIEKLHTAVAKGVADKGVALVSHCIVGHPSPDTNVPQVAAFTGALDAMELQFPFSDPLADGPVIALANQQAVNRGVTVDDCLALARQVCAAHETFPFIAMTYYNVAYRRGVNRFVGELADIGVSSLIVPDLPPEESEPFRKACAANGLGTVFLVTPLTTSERVKEVADLSTGFVYCVGRPGVTGQATTFDPGMLDYLARVKEASSVPVGVGFGIRSKEDVTALVGTVDMAIIGTETIRRVDADGVEPTAVWLSSLR